MAQFWTLSFACQRKSLAGRIFRPHFFTVHVSIFVSVNFFTTWTILWGKIVWSVCLPNKTTMAESYPISGQYSPDHRNPYRTNEAFHFDPDEEEKLAGHLEGIIITRFLLNRFFLKFHRHYVWVFFIKVWISWCWKSWKHLTFTCTCIRESYITCTCIKVQIRYRSYFVKYWPFTWCVCLHVRKLHKY